MTGVTHTGRWAESASPCVYGLRQPDESGRVWYYFVSIDPRKEKAFLRRMQGREPFLLEAYGTVLRREPESSLTPELIGRLEAEYKCTFTPFP